MCYYRYFVHDDTTGNIGRLVLIPFGESKIDSIPLVAHDYIVPLKDNIASQLSSDTIITIGDSFCRQGQGGFLQYLGQKLSSPLLYIQLSDAPPKPEQTLVRLINKGKIRPNSVVVLESVERLFIQRLSNLNFMDNASIQYVYTPPTPAKVKIPFSLEYFARWMKVRLGYKNSILQLDLSYPFFSNEQYAQGLYIYHSPWDKDSELSFLNFNESIYEKAKENLLKLKKMAEDNDITLIYVIAVDKYDLYAKYILNNPYPYNPTMDYFADLDTTWFVDTKRLLRPCVEAGMKDVYYVNDTHWSPIGAKIVGEHIATLIADDLDSLELVN